MALLGQAVMVAMYDLEPGWEDKHDDWHSHEHMEERVSIPGFLRGRRYLSDVEGAWPRCFVYYEAETLEALSSDDYFARLDNPTKWSSTTMPHFRDMMRTLCQVTVSAGQGAGGRMAYVSLSPEAARADELRAWLADTLPALCAEPGILAAHLFEGDEAASSIQTKEKELRGSADKIADWLLLVEGYGFPAPIFESGPLQRQTLLDNGAASVGKIASYTLGALLADSDI